MVQKEALRVYEEVNRVLCAKYGYAGIYIIFDEFSKYIEGHEAKEFCKGYEDFAGYVRIGRQPERRADVSDLCGA